MFDSGKQLGSLLAVLVNKKVLTFNEATWIYNGIPQVTKIEDLSTVTETHMTLTNSMAYDKFMEMSQKHLRHKNCGGKLIDKRIIIPMIPITTYTCEKCSQHIRGIDSEKIERDEASFAKELTFFLSEKVDS